MLVKTRKMKDQERRDAQKWRQIKWYGIRQLNIVFFVRDALQDNMSQTTRKRAMPVDKGI